MFTGIVEKTSHIVAATDGPHFRRLILHNDWPDIKLGESIAVNGCCLTVAEITPVGLNFDVIKETLDKTNLGELIPGDLVNVERTLKVGDRIDGHFVQGHIDTVGILTDKVATNDEWRLSIQAPDH